MLEDRLMKDGYRINKVAKLTGLSKDVIRVWERRYGLIQPMRGPNRYRLYTDEDVALLRYLRSELDKGQSIGDLAALGRDELLRRVHRAAPRDDREAHPHAAVVEELVRALDPLDRLGFERRLNEVMAVLPFEEAVHQVLLPLQVRVGELWHDQRISEAVEHYVTKQVQKRLFAMMNQLPVREDGLAVVVACPPGEEHEIGAQAAALYCATRGHRTFYLGPNVPIRALARFCGQVHADLALLSFVTKRPPAETAALVTEFDEQLRPLCPIGAGGAASREMRQQLEAAGIDVVEGLELLGDLLAARRGSRRERTMSVRAKEQ